MARKLALGARFFFAQPVPPPVAVQVGALVQPVLLRLVRASDFLAAATKDQVKFAHFFGVVVVVVVVVVDGVVVEVVDGVVVGVVGVGVVDGF